MHRAFLTIVMALVAMTLAPAAYAQTAPPTLTGETFSEDHRPDQIATQTVGSCHPDGNSTFTYQVSGVAVGPYPGTYFESGRVTIGPQVLGGLPFGPGDVPIGVNVSVGPLLFVDATFTILSPVGNVTGIKNLVVQGPPNFGSCLDSEVFVFAGALATGHVRDFRALDLRYEATIDSPLGVFHDEGSSEASLQDISGHFLEQSGSFGNQEFIETFQSDLVAPVSLATPGLVTGGGQIMHATGSEGVAFGFEARSDGEAMHGLCNVVDRTTGTHVRCLDVTLLAQTATHATFAGRAEVNGVITRYRIDVDDLDESGIGRDTFKIETDSGFVAGGVLTEGNIQIHEQALDADE